MSFDEGLYTDVGEALEPLGTLSMRKMMGGATLYLDGVIFAILEHGQIWFKADAESDAAWDARGCEKFSMTFKDGRVGTMNYRRGPDEVYDDPDSMRRWAALALEAGVRGVAKKRPRTKPH
jgi:DNA transformation protein